MCKKKIPNDGILRLIPKQKKGIFKLIFSRLFMILVMITIQIFIIGSLYIRMNEATPYFKVFFDLLTAVSIIWLFNCEMDSTAKLTWMIIFFIFPVPGTILFVLTQRDFGHYAINTVLLLTMLLK